MSEETIELYKERERRMEDAIDLKIPDRVPVVFYDEAFVAKHADVTVMDYTLDQKKRLFAIKKFLKDFEPDVFEDILQTHPFMIGYEECCRIKLPGIDLPPDEIFQLIEEELIGVEGYDHMSRYGLMASMLELLPKISEYYAPTMTIGIFNFLSVMLPGFLSLASQIRRTKEWGFPTWWGSILMDPFSKLSYLRSHPKFCLDLYRSPDKIRRTAEKMLPQWIDTLCMINEFTGVPRAGVGMHRSGISIISQKHFEEIAFPEMKKIADILVSRGLTPCFHCDGDWTQNLPYLRELPKGKCVVEFDQSTDIYKAKDILGGRLCIMGNIQENEVAMSSPAKIEEHCRTLIDKVGEGGGYVMRIESSDDAKPKNVKAVMDAAKKYGVY